MEAVAEAIKLMSFILNWVLKLSVPLMVPNNYFYNSFGSMSVP